jgi:CheY-like chemotaxis protein
MITDKNLHILTVEDNPDTQTLLRYMLKPYFSLVFSSHVDDALAQAETYSFGLLLLDINLGEQRTGIDLLQLLRQRPGYATTPALALTAYAMPGDRDRFIEAGFDGYISKPFTRRDLLDAIEKALDKKRLKSPVQKSVMPKQSPKPQA